VFAGVLCWGMGEFGVGNLSGVADARWICFSMDLHWGRKSRAGVAVASDERHEKLADDMEGGPPQTITLRDAPCEAASSPHAMACGGDARRDVIMFCARMGMSSGLFDPVLSARRISVRVYGLGRGGRGMGERA